MALDLNVIKQKAEELEKRTGSDFSKFYIGTKDLDEPIDFRLIEPLPNLEGLYYLEVPIWWVNGNKVTSLEFIGKDDVIQAVIDEARATKDQSLIKLLEAAEKGKGKKVQKKYEYWMIGLQLEFKFDKNGDITGIYDDEGNVDTSLVKGCVKDGCIKLLQANTTLLKAINAILTSRGGIKIIDPVEGSNIQLARAGNGINMKYSAVKVDVMPMPEEFYEEKNKPDMIKIVKSSMVNAAYQEAIILNYLYGADEAVVPESKDGYYLFPKLREETQEVEEEEDKPKRPSRRSEPAPESRRNRPIEEEAEEEEEAPVRKTTRGAAPTPTRRAGRRNLVDDIENLD